MLQTNVILKGGKFGRKLKQQVLSPIFDDDRDLPPPSRAFFCFVQLLIASYHATFHEELYEPWLQAFKGNSPRAQSFIRVKTVWAL